MNRVKDYADYYAELPGGNLHGRALQCDIFDLSELGPYAERVLNPSPFIAYVEEVPHLTMGLRTWRGFATLVRVSARTTWAKVRRRPSASPGTGGHDPCAARGADRFGGLRP